LKPPLTTTRISAWHLTQITATQEPTIHDVVVVVVVVVVVSASLL
jgi:hypothetical protein